MPRSTLSGRVSSRKVCMSWRIGSWGRGWSVSNMACLLIGLLGADQGRATGVQRLDQLGLLFPDTFCCLFANRPIATDVCGQFCQLQESFVIAGVELTTDSRNQILVVLQHGAIELAVCGVAERVHRGSTQAAKFRQQTEGPEHPGAEPAFLRATLGVSLAAQQGRGQVEMNLVISLEGFLDLFHEVGLGKQPRYFVFILVGHETI